MNFAGSYGVPLEEISRESFFNIGGPHGFMRWGLYIFMFIAFFYLAYTVIQRVLIWRKGQPELRTDFPEKRILAVFKYVILQAKILRESFAGIMHASLFFGFVALAGVTFFIFVKDDFTELFFHWNFITGNFYLIWSLVGDLAGGVVLIGLGMAFYRRYVTKPTRLDTKPIDTFALVLILIIIVTGFTSERSDEDRDFRFSGMGSLVAFRICTRIPLLALQRKYPQGDAPVQLVDSHDWCLHFHRPCRFRQTRPRRYFFAERVFRKPEQREPENKVCP